MYQKDELTEKICNGNVGAVSKAITYVENKSVGYLDFMDSLYNIPKKSFVIGITGAPGSGKSTFINQLIDKCVAKNKKVAIIAIDPSSQFTGGALLGDRIRFSDKYSPTQVFFRSMATRGSQGGVSSALYDAIEIFNAAKFDWIIIESVGVGQNEIDIKSCVDIVLLLLIGGMGDDIQCMKAGIMEIGDFFIINKIDIHKSDKLHRYIQHHLMEKHHEANIDNLIFKTDSLHQEGFDKLFSALENFYEKIKNRNKDKLNKFNLLLKNELYDFFMQKNLQNKIQDIVKQGDSPYKILKKIKDSLEIMLGEIYDRKN